MNVIAFIVLLGFMIFVHELGHFILAKLANIRVEEFGIGFPPRIFGIRRGETTYTLNAIPLGGFVRMLGEEDPDAPRSFARAPKRWRLAILVAGSTMNLVAASIMFAAGYVGGWPTVTATRVEIFRVIAGSPADVGGLRIGDVISGLGGISVQSTSELREITNRYLGAPVAITLTRDSAPIDAVITPRAEWPEGEGPIGIGIMDRPARVEPIQHSAFEALILGARETGRGVLLTLSIPVLAVRGLVPLELLRPVGPVGLFQATSQAAAETIRTGWWFPVLYMAGTLGAGLAVANLLPIPGLDGGRLVFVVLEALRGRRVSPRREGAIHFVGMAVLLSMVLVITYFDVLFPVRLDFSLR